MRRGSFVAAAVLIPFLPAAVTAWDFQQWHGWLPAWTILLIAPDAALVACYIASHRDRGKRAFVQGVVGGLAVLAFAGWGLHSENAPNFWVQCLAGITHVAHYRGGKILREWPLTFYAGLATLPVTLAFGTLPWLVVEGGWGGTLRPKRHGEASR